MDCRVKMERLYSPQTDERANRFLGEMACSFVKEQHFLFVYHSDPFRDLINKTMVQWATDNQIHDPTLVREMFSLLFRQYDALGEVSAALEKAYVIGMLAD